jgi:hypothetical protein
MKRFYQFIFALVFIQSLATAQDTVRVKTFTWNNSARVGVFDFPNDPPASYRKIWMRYNMRCTNGAAGGCKEWDYSCNTFVTDSSRVDSSRATGSKYTVPGFTANGFQYHPLSAALYRRAYPVQRSSFSPGLTSTYPALGPFTPNGFWRADGNSKQQILIPASAVPGLTAGQIRGLQFNCTLDPGDLSYVRVRLQQVPAGTQLTKVIETGWQEVYLDKVSKPYDQETAYLPFYQPFTWDGTSSILMEWSYTHTTTEPILFMPVQDGNLQALRSNPAKDLALYFHGRGTMEVPTNKMNQITKDLTVMFWAYGLPEALPANTSILEALDANNRRQLNIHLPWSDGQIYFDCGNDGTGYDRINKAVPTADIEGRWNHYAFTKDAAGNMRIYINGALFHSGTGLTKAIDMKRLIVGNNINGGAPYHGGINDLSIWKRALTAAETADYRYALPSASNMDMLYAYDFDADPSNDFALDKAANGMPAPIFLPKRRLVRGEDRWVNFEPTQLLPSINFWQGDFTINSTPSFFLDEYGGQQPAAIIRNEVIGNALVPVDTQIVYPTGPSIAYTPAGLPLDTINSVFTLTLNSPILTYYSVRPAKYELLSLVTPYGNGLSLGAAGKTFMFDVTDFAPILRGKKRLSMEFGGENQEEIDIEFIYVKGKPEREVLDVQPIWPQGRGNIDQILADNIFEARNLKLRADAKCFKARCAITGHEQNGEFVSREHYLNINGGVKEFNFDVWKACGRNPIYPQGGTWIFDRAGWCPGMATDVNEFDVTPLVTPGATASFDYGVNGATMATANYLVNTQLVTYAPAAHALDASIETIMRPNNQRVEFERINPTCSKPMVVVRNSGTTPITSLSLAYRVAGGFERTYQWTGTLAPFTNAEITLPEASPAFWTAGTSPVFEVEIQKVNGVTDSESANNTSKTTFTLPKNFNTTDPMRLRLVTNARAADNSYTIRDAAGNLVLSKTGLTNNTTYLETIDFAPGCYTLTCEDTGNDGLSFWFYPNYGNGTMAFQRQLANGTWVALHTFNPDFGRGVQFDFVVGSIVGTEDLTTTRHISVYPNPARQNLQVALTGFEGADVQVRLSDLTGRILSQQQVRDLHQEQLSFDVSQFPSGLYVLHCTDGLRNYTQQVVIK